MLNPAPARRRLFIAIILVLGILVVALAGEGMVRVFAPPFVIVAPAIKEPHPQRGYGLIPGVVGRAELAGEYDVTYVINSLGFRDREYAVVEPTRQILFLGDSFVFGSGVDLRQTFPKVIERRLNVAADHGATFSSINMGIYGYSSEQSLLILRELGGRFHPELVVYTIVGAYDYPRNMDGIMPMPMGSLPAWIRNGMSHSMLLQFLLKLGSQIASSSEWTAPEVLSDRAPGLFARGVKGTEEALAGMRAWAEQRGAGFVVVYLPLCYELNREEWDARGVGSNFDEKTVGAGLTMPARLTEEIAARGGFHLVNLLPQLRKQYRAGLYFLKDRHLTPGGHDLVAGILLEELRPLVLTRNPAPR